MEILVAKETTRPIVECVLPAKNDQAFGVTGRFGLVPYVLDEDLSITKDDYSSELQSTRKFLHESLTNPSRVGFILSSLSEIDALYKELNFDNELVYDISFKLIQEFAKNKKLDVRISKTSDSEILFYTEGKGKFQNLIIDNDGDIQYIFIGKKLGEEKAQVFSHDEIKDYSSIASLI